MKAIITGVTGMVGEGVLHECFHHPDVEKVLVINRKPSGFHHPKLAEVIHADFFDLSSIPVDFREYDACFFCLGVSSVGMKQGEYFRLTYELTMHVAGVMSSQHPGMVFCYISGAATDSSEKGRSNWARVKGKTENDLMKLPFKKAYMFRPGFLQPTKTLKNTQSYYKYMSWMFPFLRLVASKYVSTLRELGLAMIKSVTKGYEKQILEVKDIVTLAAR